MSSPVAGLQGSLMAEMSSRNEFSVFIDDEMRQRVLKGVVMNYYANPNFSNSVIFDSSRAWCARMNLIAELFPNAKVIACVRDMRWIIDSIERLIQNNSLQPSSIFNFTVGGTVYSRAEGLANGDGMVGYAYNALKQAYFGPCAHKMMLVRYESLVNTPESVLTAIYEFIGEEPFQHDFDNVEFLAADFDAKAGTPGLHMLRRKVGAIPRKTVLPPDVFNRFEHDAFWDNSQVRRSDVPIV